MKNMIKEETSSETADVARQYVTFAIGDESYGVEVSRVYQIIEMIKINFIPNTIDYMKGVINLRGMVMPVVDMRCRFRMEEKADISSSVIIIIETGSAFVGTIVDTVSDVVSIPEEKIQDMPGVTSNIDTQYISGIGSVDDNPVILLDIDYMFSDEDLYHLSAENKNERDQHVSDSAAV